jgi:hypothetical protein
MEELTLAGRKFVGISQSLTANQDDYIIGHMRRAGVLDVLVASKGKKFTQEQEAEELLTAILLSGRTQQILAGCLTEEGKAWTREEADRNATCFAAITDEKEKAQMRTAIVGFVIGFFSSGERSQESSPKSSSPNGRGRRTKSAAQSTSGTSRN